MSEQQKTQRGVALATAPAQQNDDAMTIDLVDLFYRLLASWKLIVCLAIVFAIVAGVYTIYFVTPQYKATSIIYVLSPESILNMSSLQLGTALTSDYIKVFDMWEVHEEVISNLDLDYTYSQMRKKLSVTNSSGTRMLDISFTSPSPAEAATVANEYAKVASNYIQETMATDKPNIMSVALEPTNPVSPNRVRNVALGFVLGGMLAAAIVVFRFLMDDKIRTVDDIRQYAGLVTLAVVPIEDSVSNENTEKKKLGLRRKS
ncbi:MAG: Wzz/FepE/Etk N-terminal domain-containing protein [Clostridia bacterium]|nr:Wzz/FepE/Etk N-terminal domain-containing protein [Clostridia bacterium]